MSSIITKILTFFTGKYQGRDEFGNKYYESKSPDNTSFTKKRWVIYNGQIEASKVSPRWFNWLHYQNNDIPLNNEKNYFWEKDYQPNLTGTKYAYYPSGNTLSGKDKRDKSSGDYQAWNPNGE